MQPQQPHACLNLTPRINKLSLSTLSVLNPALQTATSRDQLLSSRHSHRKYKLSHSQIDKIDKMSMGGTMKWNARKEDFIGGAINGKHHLTECIEDKRHQCEELQVQPILKNSHIQHTTNYHVTKDTVIELENHLSLKVQIIQFKIPIHQNNIKPVSVICFQLHNPQHNTHFRSQFTFQTLGPQFTLLFDSVEDIFDYLTSKQTHKLIHFCIDSFDLLIKVEFQKTLQKTKTKSLQLHLLPFAVIQIVQNHKSTNVQDISQTKKNIDQLHKDLQIQSNLLNALRQQNDQLKLRLQNKDKQLQALRKDNLLLSDKYQEIKKASEHQKDYFFDFIPDPRAKNLSNFSYKNNILVKQKNDLKWDQICSEAPLPHTQRHYFTILPSTQTPDYMFGIVTLKGKETVNAFLGTQVICLYINKKNVYVYERGQHYKVNRSVGKGDLVVVVVDREKGVIEWIKRSRGRGEGEITDRNNQLQTQTIKATQDNGFSNVQSKPHKSSLTIPNSHISPIQTLNPSQLSNTLITQQQFIHSTQIPEQMLSHQLYAYLEVYNINQPLKLNLKK